MRLEDAVALAWEFELTLEQRTLLARAAGLPATIAERRSDVSSWGALSAVHRAALIRSAAEVCALALNLSREVHGARLQPP